MNWTVGSTKTLTRLDIEYADGVCEHLKVGDFCHVVGEQDSFGPVTRFYQCQACFVSRKSLEQTELCECHDCHCEFTRGELEEWKPFDFYAPQGDEPLLICGYCWDAPKHQARIARDVELELLESENRLSLEP